ncbi:MAG: zinc ribbon domain-containing protein [Erysipelotrichaceae bacterium]
MRKNKAEHGLKYSSKYPLSGLITCGYCESGYTRCTWQNKKGKKNGGLAM